MKSTDLGLPIECKQYHEYFHIPANTHHTEEKNKVTGKSLKNHNSKSMLDMAYGTVTQLFYLTRLGCEVVGSDFGPALLEIARKNPKQTSSNKEKS